MEELQVHSEYIRPVDKENIIGDPPVDNEDISDFQVDNEDNADDSAESIILNIGGYIYETQLFTIKSKPDTKLATDAFRNQHYRPKKRDYYFDRDGTCFDSILQYYRKGHIHIAPGSCSMVLREEMEFWGIPESAIALCCWATFSSALQTAEKLQELEKSIRKSKPDLNASSSWQKLQVKVWCILERPASCRAAMVSIGNEMQGCVLIWFVSFACY